MPHHGVDAALPSVAMQTAVAVPLSLRFAAWYMPWFALLILVFARGTGNLSRLLSHPLCVRLGEISFAFYLVHFTVLRAFAELVTWNGLVRDGIAFAVTLGLSLALHAGVERPMRARLRAPHSRPPNVGHDAIPFVDALPLAAVRDGLRQG